MNMDMDPMSIDKDSEPENWESHGRTREEEDRLGFIRKVYGILSV